MYTHRLDLKISLYASYIEGDRYFRAKVIDNEYIKLTTICSETFEWLNQTGKSKFRKIK